jgi:transposase
MRGRPFEVAWREPDTPETLKAVYQKERDPELRTRRHGLWLLHCGWHLGRIAEAMGTHYGSAQRWVAWYRKDGLPEAQRHKMGGREPQPFLSPAAEFRVSDAVATGRFRTAWEIRDWIAQHYGASYTLGGVYSLLQRLKCAPPRCPIRSTPGPTERCRQLGKRGLQEAVAGAGVSQETALALPKRCGWGCRAWCARSAVAVG